MPAAPSPFISSHAPVITNRILFKKLGIPPVPIITTRINFTGKWDIDPISKLSSRAASSSPEGSDTGFEPPSPESEEESEESDESEDDQNTLYPARKKIPKPQGEPGRPHSGGYTLSKVLKGWGDKFKIISAFIKDEADKTLDITLCYKDQPPEMILSLCQITAKRFPILEKYEDNWPARDILKTHIKYRHAKRRVKHKGKKST